MPAGASRDEVAQQLVEQYVSETAPRQINIPSKVRKECMAALADGTNGADALAEIFEPSREEIYQLMARDSLPRYKASKEFEDLLNSFGSYGAPCHLHVHDQGLQWLPLDPWTVAALPAYGMPQWGAPLLTAPCTALASLTTALASLTALHCTALHWLPQTYASPSRWF